MIHPVLDGGQDAGDLLLYLRELTLLLLPPGAGPGLGRVPGLAIFLDEGGDELRVQQLPLQPAEHPVFHLFPLDAGAIAADRLALVAERRAAIPGLVDQRVAGAAAAADEKAREQIGRAAGAFRARCRALVAIGGDLATDGSLALLDPAPEIVVEDPQLRNIRDDPFFHRVGPGLPLAGIRVVDERLTVPDETADIEFVVEDAVAATAAPADCGRTPDFPAASRAGDAFLVQRRGNRARRYPLSIALENPSDHGGLADQDLPLACGHRAVGAQGPDHLVAIADAPRRLAVSHPPFQAAMGLLPQVLQEQRRHRPAEADMHLVDLTLGFGDDPHAEKGHALVQAGDMLLIAQEPVQRFGHDHVDSVVHRCLLQLLEARPQMGCAAHSLVCEYTRHRPSVIGAELLAHANLIGNRSRGLHLA